MKKILLALSLALVLTISMLSVGVTAATEGDVDVDLGSVTKPVGGQGDVDVDMGDITKPVKPFESKVIDFETQYEYDDTKNMQQETTGGIDNSGSLHILKRTNTAGGTTFLNWASIVTNKNDKTFITKVDPDTQYQVSVKVKFTETMTTTEKLVIYYDYYSNIRKDVDYATVKTGEWITYTAKLTTKSDQNLLGFAFRAGFQHPEMYMDDIVIKKVKKNYEGPQTDVHIDFEEKDKYVIEQNERASIDETVGPNGNITNAYHTVGGEYSTASFINWTGITNYTDDVFCIPVTPNSYYKVSMWVKMEEGEKAGYGNNTFDIFYHYEGYGDLAAISKMEKVKINDIKGKGWVKYEREFLTRADQNFIRVTVNATKIHPDFWVDDIVVKKQMTGFVADTKLSYSEDLYNLVGDTDYAASGNITEKTAIELTARALTKYTFGGSFSGNGTVTVAFDKEGAKVIKKIPVTATEKRTGFDLLTDEAGKVYVIFEPEAGKKITYKNLTVFNTLAFASATAMGYETNPGDEAPDEYNAVFVDQTKKGYVPFGDSDYSGTTPNSGDATAGALGIALVLAPIALMAVAFSYKKRVRG